MKIANGIVLAEASRESGCQSRAKDANSPIVQSWQLQSGRLFIKRLSAVNYWAWILGDEGADRIRQ